MTRQFISSAIGSSTDARSVRGRENVPAGDSFAWWSCIYIYINRISKKEYRLEQLQKKYHLGFAEEELWDVIEKEYDMVEEYIMNVNHPKRNGNTDDIVFED